MFKLKYENLYERLRNHILACPAGSQLPSIRELMSRNMVSQYTVDRTLGAMEKEGLIVRRVGQGIFVAGRDVPPASRAARRIMLAAPNYPSSIYDILLDEVQSKVTRDRHIPLRVRYNYRERISRWLPRDKFDGLILIPPAIWFTPEHVYWLSKLPVPSVLLAQFSDLAVDCVDTDNALAGALPADHLIKLGHRRLAVLITEPHVRNIEVRVQSFVRQARLAGIEEVRVIDCQTQSGQFSCGRAYEEFRKIIHEGGLDFTGLFVLGDAGAMGVLKASYDAGIAIPRQLSVVGFDDLPYSGYTCPSLTTVGQDYRGLAEEAVKILHERLEGNVKGHIHRLTAPRLVIRESTQAATEEKK
jgi:DNA-binding LacI/PurR family transcriptional regulator